MGQQEIINLFLKRKNEPLTIKEIAEAIGVKKNNVWRSIKALLKAREVEELQKKIMIERKDTNAKVVIKVKIYRLNHNLFKTLIKLNKKKK